MFPEKEKELFNKIVKQLNKNSKKNSKEKFSTKSIKNRVKK